MVFALFGGDARSVRLCALLREDGHVVRPFALEKVLADCACSPAEALACADAVIFPFPCEREGGLNSPLSFRLHEFAGLLEAAPPGLPVLAGRAGEPLRSVCRRKKLSLRDYALREDYLLHNAELTAEGALGLLLAGEGSLRDSRVLIVGFGRIGQRLAAKLTALGARVTVAARKREDRLGAALLGCAATGLPLPMEGRWDTVVNTVPAPVLDADCLRRLKNARCIELASPPYGFDFSAAAALGLNVELASGLPGKASPLAAAAAVRDAVYGIMEE